MDIEEEVNKSLQILKLEENCSLKDIENSFRILALKCHPDRCKEKDKLKCHKQFVEINKARMLLRTYYTGGSESAFIETKKASEYEDYANYIKWFFSDVF